jgi:AraC-like DNA-binding protein
MVLAIADSVECLYNLLMKKDSLFRAAMETDSGVGRISLAGEMSKSQPSPEMQPFRTFGRYAIVYVIEGGGEYADALGHERVVRAGDMIVVFPSLGHRYGPAPGQMWREVYLVFEGAAFEAWEAAGVLDASRPVLHVEPVATWRRRLTSVLDASPPMTPAGALVEVCRLQQLLADVLAANDATPHGRDVTWLAQARSALESDTPLPEVARELHCSYATLRRRFAQLTGVSPTRYRAQRRIERACELMHRGDTGDKQIALELGFCDEFHFSRRFKQITGLSPRAYRRSLP